MGKLSFNVDDYYIAMKQLLPNGPAWELEDSSFFMKMIKLAALEFARVDADIQKLIREADPQTAKATIKEWFKQWGIPEECLKDLDSDNEQLRDELLIKIRTLGCTFPELVSTIGQFCGYTTTKLDCADIFTCASTVDDRIYSSIWRYWYYMITVDDVNNNYFLSDSRVNKRLNEWGNELFECLIKHYTPAHTGVIFQYGDK